MVAKAGNIEGSIILSAEDEGIRLTYEVSGDDIALEGVVIPEFERVATTGELKRVGLHALERHAARDQTVVDDRGVADAGHPDPTDSANSTNTTGKAGNSGRAA